MRAVVQRVSRAAVEVGDERISEIGEGLLVLIGVARGDDLEAADYLARKILNLRIFEDREGKMNLSVGEVGGALLVVSQFTLHGDCRRGHRPGFSSAEQPKQAARLFEETLMRLRASGLEVRSGRFGARMRVESVNQGPVTILLDSTRLF